MSQIMRFNRACILNAAQYDFLQNLLDIYRNAPHTLDDTWKTYLRDFDDNNPQNSTPAPLTLRQIAPFSAVCEKNATAMPDQSVVLSLRTIMMIRAYRVCGHHAAKLDPLGLDNTIPIKDLDPSHYGFDAVSLQTTVQLDGVLGFQSASVQGVLEKLRSLYCGAIGFEFMHIQDPQKKSWLQENIEKGLPALSLQEKKNAFEHLVKAESFERFLHVKFVGAKRFGLEGGEVVLALLEAIAVQQTQHHTTDIYLGMAHRGRLNILCNFLRLPFHVLCAQFKGLPLYKNTPAYYHGDVKYHQGYNCTRTINTTKVNLTLLPNPSHLEAVNPVVLGAVRCKQKRVNKDAKGAVLGILLHGDAAFAGQGLVAETLELSALDGYETHGTIHVLINNQIGFTTAPPMSRSSPYASDLAKVIEAPVFHVNGDDVEAVLQVTKLAVDFKNKFHNDVVIDVVCYRRHGHNEGDEPSFTQPVMYNTISNHPSVVTRYQQKLRDEGVMTQEEQETLKESIKNVLSNEFLLSDQFNDEAKRHDFSSDTQNMENSAAEDRPTGFDVTLLQEKLIATHTHKSGFNIHPKLDRVLAQRERMFKNEQPFDWGVGEILAFASLLDEGYAVRLSGQDSCRGTFSHRHATWVDQKTQQTYTPLTQFCKNGSFFEIVDSPLAEASVLGFEYGYSLSDPKTLVLWEAQFGDFANGAQVIIDQFISSGRTKWNQQSNLVMLLPHGFEGQGPEHSSARLERYLQLCAHQNWRILNCTTPANIFHALRRQVLSPNKIPAVIMTPKSLLRHKNAVSPLEAIGQGTTFEPFIADKTQNIKQAKRHVFCTGKIYYDLLETYENFCEKQNTPPVAIHRVEQLYPFPCEAILQSLGETAEIEAVWCQEEPANMGAWHFIAPHLQRVLKGPLSYAGRPEAASPATGYLANHTLEQKKLLEDALINA